MNRAWPREVGTASLLKQDLIYINTQGIHGISHVEYRIYGSNSDPGYVRGRASQGTQNEKSAQRTNPLSAL